MADVATRFAALFIAHAVSVVFAAPAVCAGAADAALIPFTPELRKDPDGRLSLHNGAFTLPLDAGANEVVVALANAFFGWGLVLRLDDPSGVTLAPSLR
jgi:hypothetical protein